MGKIDWGQVGYGKIQEGYVLIPKIIDISITIKFIDLLWMSMGVAIIGGKIQK